MTPQSDGSARREVHWQFHGRVQGVGFRYFTQRTADALGIDGWVRNLPGGTVEVAAAGSAADLEQFRSRLRDGPPAGRVTKIEELTAAGVAVGKGFGIRR